MFDSAPVSCTCDLNKQQQKIKLQLVVCRFNEETASEEKRALPANNIG